MCWPPASATIAVRWTVNESAGATDTEETLRRLREWDISGMGLHPDGSNYVFVVRLDDPAVEKADADDDANSLYGIYKPRAGERPLHDFPGGTLHLRERAAFVLSEALGWPLVPPTVVRDGPHGEGSVQLFIDADPEANFFTLRDDSLNLFAPIAMFDVLACNADRKGGSCLKAKSDGRLWAIDHGLTFNPLARRRTVMFEFNGTTYPAELKSGLSRLLAGFENGDAPAAELGELLSDGEIESLKERGERMLTSGVFPVLDPNRNVPWPIV